MKYFATLTIYLLILWGFLKMLQNKFSPSTQIAAQIEKVKGFNLVATKVAVRFNLPVATLLSMIMVESGGNSFAQGSSGEKGLMQVSKAAQSDTGIKGDLFVPYINILTGGKYLNDLLGRTGNMSLAIQSYNQGYSRVKANSEAGKDYLDKVLKNKRFFNE